MEGKSKKQNFNIDESMLKEIGSAASIDDIKKIFQKNGVGATDEEIKLLFKKLSLKYESSNKEISEDELCDIAGGEIAVSAILGGMAAIVTIIATLPNALDAIHEIYNKLKKSYNKP